MSPPTKSKAKATIPQQPPKKKLTRGEKKRAKAARQPQGKPKTTNNKKNKSKGKNNPNPGPNMSTNNDHNNYPWYPNWNTYQSGMDYYGSYWPYGHNWGANQFQSQQHEQYQQHPTTDVGYQQNNDWSQRWNSRKNWPTFNKKFPPPAAPPQKKSKRLAIKAVDKRLNDIKKKKEKAQETIKDLKHNLDVKKQVEQLKKTLQAKKRFRSLPPQMDEQTTTTTSEQDNNVQPTPVFFDLPLTSDDFKDIGTGKVADAADIGSDQPPVNNVANNDLTSSAEIISYAQESNAGVAKTALVVKKKKRNYNETPPKLYNRDEEKRSCSKKAANYKNLAEKLKSTLLNKDKNWLQDLVNGDTDLTTKRSLVSNLVKEYRERVSKEFSLLRFGGTRLNNVESAMTTEEESSPEGGFLGATEMMLNEVDLNDLPEDFVTHIQNMIKKERPEVCDNQSKDQPEAINNDIASGDVNNMLVIEEEEIQEIPLPEKPPVPLITLDVDEEKAESGKKHCESDESEGWQPVNNHMEILRMLADEEGDLFNKLRKIDEEKSQILERLDYLREFRLQILNNQLS